jgi:hypothetical protein
MLFWQIFLAWLTKHAFYFSLDEGWILMKMAAKVKWAREYLTIVAYISWILYVIYSYFDLCNTYKTFQNTDKFEAY